MCVCVCVCGNIIYYIWISFVIVQRPEIFPKKSHILIWAYICLGYIFDATSKCYLMLHYLHDHHNTINSNIIQFMFTPATINLITRQMILID